MADNDQAPLLYGPYEAPAVKLRHFVDDATGARVQVGGWTAAPIRWPRRAKTGKHSPILMGDLVRAVQRESSEAVAYHWGVSQTTVWAWRKALGVDRVTDGTRELLRERTGVPEEAAARGRARAAEPEAIERMAATKRGQPMADAARAALDEAIRQPKPEGWGRRANEWMLAGKGVS